MNTNTNTENTYFNTGLNFLLSSGMTDRGLEILSLSAPMKFQVLGTGPDKPPYIEETTFVGVVVTPAYDHQLPQVQIFPLKRAGKTDASGFNIVQPYGRSISRSFQIDEYKPVLELMGYKEIPKPEETKPKPAVMLESTGYQPGHRMWLVWPEGADAWMHTMSIDFAQHVARTAGGSNVIEYQCVPSTTALFNKADDKP